MRVNEEIKVSGFFWLPSNPQKQIAGELTISDGGNIELETTGFFEGSNTKTINQFELNRIVGKVDQYGFVTLDDCLYLNKKIFSTVSKSKVHVSKALTGVAFGEGEEILLNSFCFSVDGIDEWVGLSGINVQSNFEKRTSVISFSEPEQHSFALDNGMKLLITYSYSLPGFPVIKEAKITQKAYFKLVKDELCSLDEFAKIAHQITTLLCFAIDETVSIGPVIATSSEIKREWGNGKTSSLEMSLFYSSLTYIKRTPKITLKEMLFRYENINERAQSVFNNWLFGYERYDAALNLYFSTKTGAHKYWDSKFLALVQGLEAYHRRVSNEKVMKEEVFSSLIKTLINNCPSEKRKWVAEKSKYWNELSFRSRIKKIIQPFKDYFGNNKEQKKLIDSIVNTRNYLTHYDTSLKSKAAKKEKLWVLCQKTEAIFQLLLLKELGFTLDEIEKITVKNWNLNYKLNELLLSN